MFRDTPAAICGFKPPFRITVSVWSDKDSVHTKMGEGGGGAALSQHLRLQSASEMHPGPGPNSYGGKQIEIRMTQKA